MPKLPSAIKDAILVRKQPNFSSSTCNGCTGKCCSGPGFALLENVQQIFEIYSKGLLKRDDFEFKKGLDFCAFIQEYFDRVYFNNTLLTFFPKTLSENDRLMHIPPWSCSDPRKPDSLACCH